MPTARTRRIVRRAVLALAGFVLLTSGYVSSFLAMFWMRNNGPAYRWSQSAHAPIYAYIESELPGSVELCAVAWWCEDRFKGPFSVQLDLAKEQSVHNKAAQVPIRNWSPFQ